MSKKASRFVGSIPEYYDRSLGPLIFTGYAADLARRVADLGPAAVLELAAGTGIVTRELRNRLKASCELIATDLNQPMLTVAESKFRSDESVRFDQADATSLQYDEGSFDAVVCQFGVMFFPDKRLSYSEAFRVLKPDGSYLFSVWDSWDENPFAAVAHEVVARFFPEDPPGFYHVPFHYHDPDEIRDSVSHAGFREVTIEHLEMRSKIPSALDFAKGLVFGNPLFEEISERGGDPEEVCEAVAQAVDRQLGGDMPLRALVVHASKI